MSSRLSTTLQRKETRRSDGTYEASYKKAVAALLLKSSPTKVHHHLQQTSGVTVPIGTLKTWKQAVTQSDTERTGAARVCQVQGRGRPPSIPPEVKPAVLEAMTRRLEDQDPAYRRHHMRQIVSDALIEFAAANPERKVVVGVSKRAMDKYIKELEGEKSAERRASTWGTARRKEVASDPRTWASYLSVVLAVHISLSEPCEDASKTHRRVEKIEEEVGGEEMEDEDDDASAVMAMMLDRIHRDIHLPALVWNMDATSFAVKSDAQAAVNSHVLVPGSEADQNASGTGKVVLSASTTNHARVRVYCAGSASGSIATPVTAVEDKSCEEPVEVLTAHAPGVNCGTGGQTEGLIVKAKSRSSWKVGHLALMHVLRNMVAHRTANSELHGRHMALFIDGASDNTKDVCLFIDGVSDSSEVLEFCGANKIILVKLPGGSTAISQPLDVGSCFRSAKSNLRASMNDISPEEIKRRNGWRLAALTRILCDKPTPRKGAADLALFMCRVQDALAAGLRSDHVRNSFAHAGYLPYNAEKQLGYFSGGAIGLGFKGTRGVPALRAAATAVHELALKYHAQGHLAESDYEEAGFRTSEEETDRQRKGLKPRDERCIQQQRAVILTSREFAAVRVQQIQRELKAAVEKRRVAARSKRIKQQEKERAKLETTAWDLLLKRVSDEETPSKSARLAHCRFCGIRSEWTRDHEVLARLHINWKGPLCPHCNGFRVCPRQECQKQARPAAHRDRCNVRKRTASTEASPAHVTDLKGVSTPPRKQSKRRRRQ